MLNQRLIYIALISYFIALLLLAPINLLSFDTYYYWDWSRHLALSYYDGSPMIAYFIKLSTLLFGDTLFALSFVAVLVTALTSFILYKTARLFLEKEASYVALLLWLFSPLVFFDILKQTTYDTPLTLFWALTVYLTVKFIKFNQTKELYFIGASIGLMLLSKYSGIVLIIALVFFLITTRYRCLFKRVHLYCALVLSVVIFSPVLIWNYQQEWQSFIYQLTTHQLNNTMTPLMRVGTAFLTTFLPSLNFMLLPPLICSIKGVDRNNLPVTLCRIICITFLCFYLYMAHQAEIRIYWLTPYLLTSALLGGFCFQTFHYRKSILFILACYGLISFGLLFNNTNQFSLTHKKLIYYRLIQQFNADYPQTPKVILTSSWFQARMLFFLKNKPMIYTIDCNMPQNQYALWSESINQQLKNKTLGEVWYLDRYEQSQCLAKYFNHCEKLKTQSYHYHNKNYSIYAYKCIDKEA